MAIIIEGLPAGGLGGGAALLNIVEDLTPQLGGNLDLNGNVITGLEIGVDIQAFSAVLDATTASFLIADETKLDGIEALAEVNVVDSVFTRIGDVVAVASDYDASQVNNDSNVNGAFVDDALDRLNSIPWDLSHVIVKGDFDVSTETTFPSSLWFSPDGIRMYVGDFTTKKIIQYTLSIPWDEESAVDSGKSFTVGAELTNIQGIALSADESVVFIVGSLPTPLKIQQYDIGTPKDISTAVLNAGAALNIDTETTNPRDIFLREDGLKFFIANQAVSPSVLQYTMATANSLVGASFDSVSFDVSSKTTSLGDIFFKDDGLKMFIADADSGDLFQAILSTSWNVSTSVFDLISFNTGLANQASLFFKKHGAKLFICDSSGDKIESFEVAKQDDNPYTDIEKTELGRLSSDLLLNEQSSGILFGGILSINGGDDTKFDFTAGLLYIVDSFTDPTQPKITSVEFSAQTAIAATEVATDNETFVGIRLDNVSPTGGTTTALTATVDGVPGTVYITQKPSDEYTREEVREIVQIGALLHSGVVITQAFNLQQIVNNMALQLYDLAFAIGIINISGNEFSPNGANLNIDKTVGDIFRQGSNNDGTADGLKNPNISTVSAGAAITFKYRHQDGSGDFTVLPDTTVIDPDQFDDGTGTLAAVGANKHTIQRLSVGPQGEIRIEYGQVIYNSQSQAEEAISIATITDPVLNAETALRGWLLIKKGATDLTVTGDAKFIAAGKFNDTSPGSMTGEINTASDVGVGGISVFKQKTGVNLEFNSIAAESSKIVVTLNAGQNEVRIDAVPGNFNTADLNNDALFVGSANANEYTKTQNFNATSLTALGADLVTNGGFAADTDWTKGTGWTIAAGVASSDGTQAGDADLTQSLSLVSGQTYEVEFTVSNYSAGNVTPVAGDVEGTDRAANGTFTENIIAGAGGDIDIRADLDFIGDIDDVTVRLANVSWDLESNQVTKLTLDGDLVLDNPTNLVDGATYIVTLTQDGVGTRLLSYGSVYKFPGGTAPTLSTGVNDVDIITFISDGTNMYGVFQGDFS